MNEKQRIVHLGGFAAFHSFVAEFDLLQNFEGETLAVGMNFPMAGAPALQEPEKVGPRNRIE